MFLSVPLLFYIVPFCLCYHVVFSSRQFCSSLPLLFSIRLVHPLFSLVNNHHLTVFHSYVFACLFLKFGCQMFYQMWTRYGPDVDQMLARCCRRNTVYSPTGTEKYSFTILQGRRHTVLNNYWDG